MPTGQYKRKFKPNHIEIEGDVAHLYLHRRDGSELICLIDSSEVGRVSQHHWHASWDPKACSFYAGCKVRGQDGLWVTLYISRFLEDDLLRDAPPGTQIDHINHDTLDDRHCNHRLATCQQNQMNRRKQMGTSQFKGVYLHKKGSKYAVQIHFKGRVIYLGLFDSELEAAKAYDKKAKELFGDRAHLNFPDEVE